MRADRLISILIILKNRGKMSTNELANELEVTNRTIHRDMESLISAGIPIESIRGKQGGWRILDNWSSKLSWLKNAEVQSLLAPYPNRVLKDLGINDDFSKARSKLLASFSHTHNQESIKLWDRIYIDDSTWRDENEEHDFLSEIKEAIFQSKKLSILYKKYDGSMDERVIDPLGMVSKGDKWYLVALKESNFRNYRISRIESATILNMEFDYPINFSLESYWKESKREFVQSLPKFLVKVEVHPSIVSRLSFSGRFVEVKQQETAISTGWNTMNLTFNSEQEAIDFIFSFGDKIRITDPIYIKDIILKKAYELIEFYKE